MELSPVWSPDGSRIAFAYQGKDGPATDIYQRQSSGAGIAEPLLKSDLRIQPTDWSRDGRFLLYEATGAVLGAKQLKNVTSVKMWNAHLWDLA